jgi:branched-chain amino acid transport system ATP-binding protein
VTTAAPYAGESRDRGSLPGLTVSGLRVAYERDIEILRGVHLSAAPGRICVVIGPNGAGKSTLLKAICGLAPTIGGEVRFDERVVTGWPARQLLDVGLALVPQDDTLFRDMSVRENLVMGGWLRRREKAWVAQRVARVAGLFSMPVSHLERRAGDLSGGQQKLLEIARSLVLEPRMLLLDEPTAGLSPKMVDQLYAHVADLARSGITLLMVDQNVRSALAIADYVYVLAMGRNNAEGPAADIMSRLEEIVASWMKEGGSGVVPA